MRYLLIGFILIFLFLFLFLAHKRSVDDVETLLQADPQSLGLQADPQPFACLNESKDWTEPTVKLIFVTSVAKIEKTREDEFEIEVHKTSGGGIGIRVGRGNGNKTVFVKSIYKGGQLDNWNMANPNQTILPGDLLIEVNGVKDNATHLLHQLKNDEILKIKVHKASTQIFELISTEMECADEETLSNAVSVEACARKCDTIYFAYGNDPTRCTPSSCPCLCENVGETCEYIPNAHYNLYKKTEQASALAQKKANDTHVKVPVPTISFQCAEVPERVPCYWPTEEQESWGWKKTKCASSLTVKKTLSCTRWHPRCGMDEDRRPSGPWMPCCEKRNMLEMLAWFKNVVDAGNKSGMFWFPSYGTLLGSARGHDIIEHDTDIDLIASAATRQWLTDHIKKHRHDVDPPYLWSDGESIDRVSLSRVNSAHIDIWYIYDTDDPECMSIHIEDEADYFVPRNWLHPFSNNDEHCLMQGVYLPCPAKPVALLDEWYGTSWRYAETGHATGKLQANLNPCYTEAKKMQRNASKIAAKTAN